jgi:hypothetical protein
MVWSAYMGLPLSLEGVGAVLKLDSQKMKEGKDLIRYFCVPCKETKSNGGRTRNLPQHAPDKWTSVQVLQQTGCGSGNGHPGAAEEVSRPGTRYGMNTISTRKSTTGASPLTGRWLKRPSPSMPAAGTA